MRGRKTFRETLEANDRALRGYAALAGKPIVHDPLPSVRPPRQRAAPGADGKPLEKDILKAILGYLHLCPAVVFAGRFNQGTMEEGGRFVRMSTITGFPDVHGMLVGGRAFYVEVKRHNGRVEPHQQRFIDKVIAGGGIAFVARSLDDVIERIHA